MKRQSPMQRLGTEPCQPPQTMQFSKLGTGSSLLSFSSEFFLKFLFFFFPSPTKRHYSLDVDTRVSSPGRSADAAQRKDPGGWLWCVMYLSLLFYSVVSVHCTLSTLCKYCTLSALLVQSTVDNIIRYSVLIFVRWSHDTHDTAKPKIARVQVF